MNNGLDDLFDLNNPEEANGQCEDSQGSQAAGGRVEHPWHRDSGESKEREARVWEGCIAVSSGPCERDMYRKG